MAFARVLVVALFASLRAYSPPSDYELDDEFAEHSTVAKGFAKAGDLKSALQSFRASCRFNDAPEDYANLGVAFMRNGELPAAYRALKIAEERNPAREGTKKNMKVLLDHAKKSGVSKKDLEAQSKGADLGIGSAAASGDTGKPASSAGKAASSAGKSARSTGKPASSSGSVPDFTWKPGGEGASDYKGKKDGVTILNSHSIAARAKTFWARGEKRLARGLISLAFHLDPFLAREKPDVMVGLENEKWDYWQGSIYLGYDKTALEALVSKDEKADINELQRFGIISWKNLQLTRLSCCGIDNLAVWLSRNTKVGHPYIVPFLELIPNFLERLKPENANMYHSFNQWWKSLGPDARMPQPQITYRNGGYFEWNAMKVALPASRVPVGWEEMVNAVILRIFRDWEGMRGSAYQALQKNEDLAYIMDELLPELRSMPTPHPLAQPSPAVADKKYVLCYNPCVGLGNIAVAMVSAHMMAKLTGRTLLVHWNQNSVTRHAYQLKEKADVTTVQSAAPEVGITIPEKKKKSIYFFHTTDNVQMSEALETIACSNLKESLAEYKAISVSTNLFFAPLLATNPHTTPGDVPEFPDLLADLLSPSPKAIKRALSYANQVEWGKTAPVIGIHIRAREAGEDNDDWPTKDAPGQKMLEKLWRCTEKAVQLELGDIPAWDVYIASTTEKSRAAVADVVKKNAKGARNILGIPKLDRNRKTGSGNTDAMAESLLFSRVDVFVRMVVGTNGFSTFAFLSNALRTQGQWAASMPALRAGTERFAPNYVVTDSCGAGRCFSASPKVRMASISWHGKEVMRRSCGNVLERAKEYSAPEEGCSHLLKTIQLS